MNVLLLRSAALLTAIALLASVSPVQANPGAVRQPTIAQLANQTITLQGSTQLTINLLKGAQWGTQRTQQTFAAGTWIFGQNGIWTFTPRPNPNISTAAYPLIGTYQKTSEGWRFQAQNQGGGTTVTFDGILRWQGDRATLDLLYGATAFNSEKVARITQTLQASSSAPKNQVLPQPQSDQAASSFTNTWELEDWGSLKLQQQGNQVTGTYTGRGGGTLLGTVKQTRLDFTSRDRLRGEGVGFFRALSGGSTLIGLWQPKTTSAIGETLLAKQSSAASSPEPVSQDKVSLRDQGYDLVLQSQCRQAMPLLVKALTLYKQERASTQNWQLLRDSYLIDELNILTRLSFCYRQTEDYANLLQTFRYVNEVKARLREVAYLQKLVIPDDDPVKKAIAQYQADWSTRLSRDLEKVNFLDKNQLFFQILTQAFVELGQPEQALVMTEQGRARALADRLATRLNQVKLTPPNLKQIRSIAQAQQATLVAYSIIKPAPAKQAFPTEAATPQLYAWVISATGNIAFNVTDLSKSSEALDQQILAARQSIGVQGRSDIITTITDEKLQQLQQAQEKSLKQLYQLLITPLAKYLPNDDRQKIIIIPQGELFFLPFSALLSHQGQSFIQQHTLLTAPSIQVLALTQQLRRSQPSPQPSIALIIGDPVMPKLAVATAQSGNTLPPLPGARREAQQIANVMQTTALIGRQAQKAIVLKKLPAANLIHFATHGLLDDLGGIGLPGAIALAPDNANNVGDGLLTADEITALRLQATLVVLSACDTGQGKITGDGVIGLSRSFITAGVPSVIVSLWKVRDDPTAFLMTEFYRNWQERKLDKVQALRQAMLSTKTKYPQPLDWAAFTLIGEAE